MKLTVQGDLANFELLFCSLAAYKAIVPGRETHSSGEPRVMCPHFLHIGVIENRLVPRVWPGVGGNNIAYMLNNFV